MRTLVGDSWCHSSLARMIGASATSRHPGATAGEIARCMVLKRGAGVVVVVAGVNDVVRHVGAGEYARGMAAIARIVTEAGAEVVLMELPGLGLVRGRTVAQRVKRWALRWWNDGGRVEVTEDYRRALREAVRCPIVPFPEIPASGWGDAMHLNDAGRAVLAKAIERFLCR